MTRVNVPWAGVVCPIVILFRVPVVPELIVTAELAEIDILVVAPIVTDPVGLMVTFPVGLIVAVPVLVKLTVEVPVL